MEEKKSKFGRGVFVGILVTTGVFLLAICICLRMGWISSNLISTNEEPAKKNSILSKSEKKINSIMKIMDAYYLDEYDEDAMVDGMLSGMLAAVGDPYTGYYNKESYSSLIESSEGVYYGIGVVVQQNPDTGEVLVVNPYEDCPGAEAGMRAGDIIYKVAGQDVTGMDLNEVVAMIRGEAGTTIEISVLHDGDKELSDLVVERRAIETHTVESELLDNSIGYVQVTQFDEVTTDQFTNAIDELAKQGIEGLIIDLRDNPGGSLTTVLDMLDVLLPKGTYTYLIDKNNKRQDYNGKINAKYDYPLVVLVNGNSASASELFSGAIHDYERGTLVGTTTFGKGIVQQVFPLRDGTGMKVTMAKYYTPNGVCIHKTGIEPDYVVELDDGEYASTVEHDQDEQFQKAIEIMMEKLKK